MFTHAIVPLDGSRLAEQILPHVARLAERIGTRLTLLRALTAADTLSTNVALSGALPGGGPVVDPTPLIRTEREAVGTYLEGVAERLRARGVHVSSEMHDGPPAAVILERAQTLGADLIAMTTHGRSGLGRLVFGSVADEVLRHATVPVLLVRATETDDDKS